MPEYKMTSLFEPEPSATYKNGVERDPPKPKPLPKNLQPVKREERR